MREEHRLRVFENRVLGIFEPNRDEVMDYIRGALRSVLLTKYYSGDKPFNTSIKCLVQWLPACIFSGVFKFQCMLLGKKNVSHRLTIPSNLMKYNFTICL
jgi:hypothetical protein